MIETLALGFFLSSSVALSFKTSLPEGSLTGKIAGYVKVKLTPERAAMLRTKSRQIELVPNGRFVSQIGSSGWTVWQVPADTNVAALEKELKGSGVAAYVEPLNRVYALLTHPNDGDYDAIEDREDFVFGSEEGGGPFRRLWHLDDTNAEAGWPVWPNTWYTSATKPANAPIIAVVDTGADMGHPDFINAGGTGPDVSQGGQWRMANSVQFHLGEIDPFGSPNDSNGHGTHVAGLALAAGNNGIFDSHGVIGIGYNCQGMMLRIFDNQGVASDADAGAAIYYAADHGADIINLSIGTESYSQLFQDAVTYAFQKGCLVVAAGNEDGTGGGDLGPIYPAACVSALAVSANGAGYVPATGTYSGYGWYVDLAAPGGDVLIDPLFQWYVIQFVFSTAMRTSGSLNQNQNLYPPYTLNYAYLAGTSMATPQVSGAAGLLYGKNNWDQTDGWNNVRAFRTLETSADSAMGAPYGGREDYQGYGCLNVHDMLLGIERPNVEVGGIKGMLYSGGTPVANTQVRAQKVSGGTIFSTTTHSDGSYRFEGLPPGTYNVTGLAFSHVKTKKVLVKLGCDTPGQDFWIDGMPFDTTPPTIARVELSNLAPSGFTVRHWGYDTETGIDQILYRIGTTSGGSEVMADLEIVPDGPTFQISGLNLSPGNYFLRARFINGNGASTDQVVPFTIGGGGTVQVPPSALTINRGILIGGALSSVLTSDDQRLLIRNGVIATSSESPITLFFDATSPTQTVTALQVKLEAQASVTNLNQYIELFDYTSNSYVLLDSRAGSINSDSIVTVPATSPNRFIQAGTRAMRLRIRYKAGGPLPVSTWQGRIDQLVMIETP